MTKINLQNTVLGRLLFYDRLALSTFKTQNIKNLVNITNIIKVYYKFLTIENKLSLEHNLMETHIL